MARDRDFSRNREQGSRSHEFVYGRRPVWEVLRAGKRRLHRLWLVPGTTGDIVDEILELARQKSVPVESVPRDHLDRMVRGGNHQGVAAQAGATTYLELDDFLQNLPVDQALIVLGLDEIEDPQNLGAILRNAGFFGVAAVIVPRWRSAPVSDTVLRASSGAAEHLSIIRVRNLVDAIEQLKESGFEVWGADMAGETLGQPEPGKRQALILGSEGKGLRRLVKEHCDRLVGIPAGAKVGSLNVASTSAIFLYELCRRSSTGRAPVL
jgi:23S rRNA (guanosine2251-2'-O)-methyltransferase